MEKRDNLDKSNREEGEEQLSALIHQAGNDARIRRKKALGEHLDRIRRVVTEAKSLNQKLKSL